MPPNTVYVGRPSRWGNPFLVNQGSSLEFRAGQVEKYRKMIEGNLWPEPNLQSIVAELRGKNLACWCREGQVCHADVLLEIANK